MRYYMDCVCYAASGVVRATRARDSAPVTSWNWKGLVFVLIETPTRLFCLPIIHEIIRDMIRRASEFRIGQSGGSKYTVVMCDHMFCNCVAVSGAGWSNLPIWSFVLAPDLISKLKTLCFRCKVLGALLTTFEPARGKLCLNCAVAQQ